MIFSKQVAIRKPAFREELESFFDKSIDSITANEVSYYFYGEYNSAHDERKCDFSIVHKYGNYESKKKWYNRLAYLVVVPIYVALIPFTWVFKGEVGINRNSTFGKFIAKIVGE